MKIVNLDIIDPKNLPELQNWKEKQESIVKENPFVKITDNRTYDEAKKHRTTLLKGRTDIEKQDKLVASKLKEFRSRVSETSKELIEITFPYEVKQQEEVKRYELLKAEKKAEKERLEQERISKIKNLINKAFNYWQETISKSNYQSFNKDRELFTERMENFDSSKFEEFELDFAEKVELLKNKFSEKLAQLNFAENQRLESERLKKERAEFERQQKEIKAKAKKEEAERLSKIEKEDKTRKKLEDKQRLEREAEAEKLRKDRQELEAEKKRIADIEAKRQAEIEAKIFEKQQAKEKSEAKKRIEALKPDVEKLTSIIKAIQIPTSEISELKQESAKKFLVNILLQVEKLQENLLVEIRTIK